MESSSNSFDTLSTLELNGKTYSYHAVNGGELACHPTVQPTTGVQQDPAGEPVAPRGRHQLQPQGHRDPGGQRRHGSDQEIAYHPARVLMQDFTGVPAVVDLAAMRDALVRRGVDPQKINPLSPVDLVIDHSVSIDRFAYQQRLRAECRTGDAAQPRALPVPEMGPGCVRQFQGGTTGHRHLPPGQPGVPGAGGMAAPRRDGVCSPTPIRS